MRARRTRARIAATLKKRADKTTSSTVNRNLYSAIKALYPLKRKVPKGQVFIPAKQLSEEAQNALARIQMNIKRCRFLEKTRGTMITAGSFIFFIGVAYGSLAITTGSKKLGVVSGAVSSVGVTFLLSSLIESKFEMQLEKDMNFLSAYLQKTNSIRFARSGKEGFKLRSRYNFFLPHSKLKGIALTNLPPETVKFFGSIKKGEVVVVNKKTGKIIFQGLEKRGNKDRRIGNRRSTEDKQTFRW